MNTEKQNWITETMRSAEGMQRAEPEPGFYERLRRSMEESRPGAPVVSTRWVMAVAASFLLLLSFNLVTMRAAQKNTASAGKPGIEDFTNDYLNVSGEYYSF